MLTLLFALIACGGESASTPAPTPAAPVATPAPAPMPAPAAGGSVASDGSPIPAGGCEFNGVVYDADGTVYGCIGGGNGCKNEPMHNCSGAPVAAGGAGPECCCGMRPTDVGEMMYERMAASVCAKGGTNPDMHDGASCVDNALCN